MTTNRSDFFNDLSRISALEAPLVDLHSPPPEMAAVEEKFDASTPKTHQRV